MDKFYLEDDRFHLDIPAFNQQVVGYFPQYDLASMTQGAVVNYDKSNNITGHQQRSWLCYYASRSFVEQRIISIDLASAGVNMPFCLSTDIVGNKERPFYGGIMSGVQIKIDANDLSIFGDDSFGAVLGNHCLEHMHCNKLKGNETQEDKLAISCNGAELADLLDNHWLRIIRPGGYLAQIFPSEVPCRRVNSSSLFHDPTHNHFLFPDTFKRMVLDRLKTPVEIIEFDTLNNNFSINLALRKK